MANKNFQVKFGLEVGSTVTADAATGNITTSGDVAVNGGDITTTNTTATVVNTNATTVNMAGAATTVSIGANTGTLTVGNPTVVGTQATQNLYNTVATTLNIGGGATTSVNIGNAAGEIDTPSDIQILGNKSIRQGDGIYSASTDIYRDNAGNAVEGVLISNNNMTNANSILVNRIFGQTTPGGDTTTAIPASVVLQGSRGTQASALPTNSGNEIALVQGQGNYGTIAASGTVFGNDLYAQNGSTSGIITTATQNFRQTAGAVFTADISGTTLTVTAVASGTITPGTEIRGTGFSATNAGYVVTRQLTTTAAANALGNTGTYELNVSPGTIASSTMRTFAITGGSSTRIWNQPSNSVGAGAGSWPASPNTTIGLTMAGGSITGNFQNFLLQPNWSSYPVLDRVVTAISGGNTLTIAGTPLFANGFYNGASVTVITAGNPNGLTTGTTYFIDTNTSPGNITLRTNSVSGGAVTGLTNGTGLFIRIQVRSQGLQSLVRNNATIQLFGGRAGYNYNVLNPSFEFTRQNDVLGLIGFVGSTNAGFGNSGSTLRFTATEDWTATNAGTQLEITANKIGSNAGTFTSVIGPDTTTLRTDSFNILNTNNTTNLTLGSGGLLTVTGNVRINGSNILNSTGNTAITMASGAAPLVTIAGNIRVSGNNIQNSSGDNNISLGSVNSTIRANTILFQDSNTASQSNIQFKPGNNLGATLNDRVTNFNLFHRRIPAGVGEYPNAGFSNWILDTGTGNYQPNLSGETLGELNYQGQYSTTSSVVSNGPAVSFSAKAAENFSSTANGGRGTITVTKIGTAGTRVDAISVDTTNAYIRSDNINLQDSSSVGIVSGKIAYNRVFGQWQYDATITPAAANTAYAFPFQGTNAVIDYANIASATNTSRIQPNATGFFNLQFSIQLENTDNGADHTAYIWWRKNGTDIANSMGRVYVTKQHQTIAGWNNMVQATATTDYFELMYAVDNVALVFPYFGTTAFGPSTAAAFLSITPVGA